MSKNIRKNTCTLTRSRISNNYRDSMHKLFGYKKNVDLITDNNCLTWEEIDALPTIEKEDC